MYSIITIQGKKITKFNKLQTMWSRFLHVNCAAKWNSTTNKDSLFDDSTQYFFLKKSVSLCFYWINCHLLSNTVTIFIYSLQTKLNATCVISLFVCWFLKSIPSCQFREFLALVAYILRGQDGYKMYLTQRAHTCFPNSVRTKHSFFRNR